MQLLIKGLISLIALMFLFNANIKAQADTAKASKIKTLAVDSICKCISQTDTTKVNNLNDAQLMLTGCITTYTNLIVDFGVAFTGIDITKMTEDKLQEMGTKIAAAVYEGCPTFRIMVQRVKSKSN